MLFIPIKDQVESLIIELQAAYTATTDKRPFVVDSIHDSIRMLKRFQRTLNRTHWIQKQRDLLLETLQKVVNAREAVKNNKDIEREDMVLFNLNIAEGRAEEVVHVCSSNLVIEPSERIKT